MKLPKSATRELNRLRAPGHWHFALGIFLLFLLSLFCNMFWLFSTPPLFAIDEGQHYLRAWDIYKFGSLEGRQTLQVPARLKRLIDAEQLESSWCKKPLDFSSVSAMKSQIAALNSVPSSEEAVDEKKRIITEHMFNFLHPPIYYCALGYLDRVFSDLGILRVFLLLRMGSVVMGLITSMASVFAGWQLFRDKNAALLLGALVTLHPMSSYTFSSITNVAPEIMLASLFSVLCLQYMKTPTRTYALFIGLILSAGVLVKISFLAFVPVALVALVWRTKSKFSWQLAIRHAGLMSLPVLVSSSWYISLLSTICKYDFRYMEHTAVAHTASKLELWYVFLARLSVSYWGGFAWNDTHFPLPVCIALSILTLLTLSGGLLLLQQSIVSKREERKAITFLIAQITSIVLFFLLLEQGFYLIIGTHFGMRGQYFLSPLLAEMALAVMVWRQGLPDLVKHQASIVLVICAFLLNAYAVLCVVLPRFFGTDWHLYAERIAVCWDVPPCFVRVPFSLFLLFGGGLSLFFIYDGLQRRRDSLQISGRRSNATLSDQPLISSIPALRK